MYKQYSSYKIHEELSANNRKLSAFARKTMEFKVTFVTAVSVKQQMVLLQGCNQKCGDN
jgi:hypothetical protein